MWIGWHDKSFILHIYKYGSNITSANDFKAFELKCLKEQVVDRAGAAAEAVVQSVMQSIKEAHPELTGDDSFYRLWADYIIKGPFEERERLIQEPPPMHLIALFSPSETEVTQRLQIATDCMAFGNEVLDVMKTHIREMKLVCFHFRNQMNINLCDFA